jgi:four helix bundle protein
MARIESFEDFDAYIAARAYVKKVYTLTRQKPLVADFVLRDQMRGALESILSNFAEGYGRQGRKEFIQFLSYSNGSLAESRAKLHVMVDQDYLTAEEHDHLQEEAKSVGKQIGGLMRYLEQTEIAGAKYQRPDTNSTNLKPRSAKGAAIISVLLVLTVLTIMVVAFLQSMRIDRLTARAYLNKTKAEMAVQAGVDEAISRVKSPVETHPDLITSWELVNGTQATVIYYRDETSSAPPPALKSYTTPVKFYPLLSGASDVTEALKATSFPTLNATNSVDLNSPRWGNQRPWIGKWPPDAATASEIRAPWVVVRDSNGKAIARYAWWAEDESFRFPANWAGANTRGATTKGLSPEEASWQPLFAELKAKGGTDYAAIDPVSAAVSMTTFRASIPSDLRFFDPGLINRGVPGLSELREDLQFLTTTHSTTTNLSRHGSKRLNLNTLFVDSNNPAEVRVQLNRFIAAVDWHLPDFGQRFYRTGNLAGPLLNLNLPTVTAPHENIYLQKLAANIRDYIDTDSQPTVINNNSGFTVRLGTAATRAIGFPIGGTTGAASDIIAYGKEAVPYLTEYALRARMPVLSPASGGSTVLSSSYEFFLDHYFEFWNLTNRDINLNDLGPNAFIKIYALPALDTAGGTLIPEGRDFSIPLADFRDGLGNPLRFPAGAAVVLTTDATPSSLLNSNPSAVFRPQSPDSYTDINGDNTRRYTGTTRNKSGSNFRVRINARSTGSTDYQTEMLLGNDNGLIESFGALPIPLDLSINRDSGNTDAERFFWRGGSLRGNSANFNQVADFRTNNEQLFFQRYRSGGDEDQTRYYNSNLGSGPTYVPVDSTFGKPSNTFTLFAAWPDAIKNYVDNSAAHAPAIIANQSMQSIGELGHIFDPSRGIGPQGINYSRGGGRTLRIGQPERRTTSPSSTANYVGLWDGSPTSVSRERAAWRLTDLFCTQDDLVLPGRINLHSCLRDGGSALTALVDGLVFEASPTGSAAMAGKSLLTANFISALKTRFSATPTSNTLFWERGELSELPLFNTGSSLATSVTTFDVDERGREELFRRIAELVTTRGNTFSVYVLGQSVQELPDGSLKVLASHNEKVTFRLNPVHEPALDNNFNPSNAAQVAARFAKPSRYEIEILP